MERNADRDVAKAHQGGCPDVLALEVEALGRRQLGADRMNPASWDASADVRRDAWADECRELPRLGVDAGKLVVRELACLAPDARTLGGLADPVAVPWPLAGLPLVSAAQGRPDAGPSAARSFVVLVAVVEPAELRRRAAEPALRR